MIIIHWIQTQIKTEKIKIKEVRYGRPKKINKSIEVNAENLNLEKYNLSEN